MKLVAGSDESTESIILSDIASTVFHHAGAKVIDQTDITGTDTVRDALETKNIDFYWEYTATAWIGILGHSADSLPDDVYAELVAEDHAHQIAWLEPAPADSAWRLATPRSFAEQNRLSTTSDVAAFVLAHPDQSRLCATSEFINQDDGLPALTRAYGLSFSQVRELNIALSYLQLGTICEFSQVFSTDPQIAADNLLVLDDDQHSMPALHPALTLRQETLDSHPAIAHVLNPIIPKLTTQTIVALKAEVDIDGKEPHNVAREWLKQQKLI